MQRLTSSSVMVVTIATILVVLSPGLAIAGGCGTANVNLVECTTSEATIGGGGVTLGAKSTTPGTHKANKPRANQPRRGATAPVVQAPVVMAPPGSGAYFRSPGSDRYTTPTPTPAAPAARPAVTLADLINFRPTAGSNNMEPAGWGLLGLDTNFYAKAVSQTLTGTLLGQPASVLFTPVSYVWNYGDGTTVTRTTPGHVWHDAADEFDRTPTSHNYQDVGDYTITLTINYSAAYRFGGSNWIPIDGTLPVTSNQLTATIGTVKTVLVQEDCNANPDGPGC